MPVTLTVQEDKLLLQVSGGLTIFQAAERKPELLHVLTLAQPQVQLDLAGVDEIDTAGIQLLLLLRRELRAQGRSLDIVGASPALLGAFDLLQLHERFGMEAA
ncbi:STAS domain-containing protein [Herbaspirillum seropedicae]|uniref:STAS domain-containing protein n=1 Tax=Herbaspirillum seropedicae TaxID=964 RepID=UPI0008480DE6|nr:STAS domain-containing protein [Herbaspirillum seropedicae]AON52928.1 anti-sigma-factor antagonist (STAS) domain-containing protein [Herbaspirillum seropedicae]